MMGMTKETHVLTFFHLSFYVIFHLYTYFRKDFTFDAKCVELHIQIDFSSNARNREMEYHGS